LVASTSESEKEEEAIENSFVFTFCDVCEMMNIEVNGSIYSAVTACTTQMKQGGYKPRKPFMAVEKPGKLRDFFSYTLLATL